MEKRSIFANENSCTLRYCALRSSAPNPLTCHCRVTRIKKTQYQRKHCKPYHFTAFVQDVCLIMIGHAYVYDLCKQQRD